MEKQLHWVKEAFSRSIVIMDGEKVVGGMHRDLLVRDVDAHLNGVHIFFDVAGFLVHSVNIHDKDAGDKIIGRIEFEGFNGAVVRLETGEKYTWQRENFMMHEWSIVAGNAESKTGHEIIHYDRTRLFLADEGTIELVSALPNAEMLILTGLFVRNYFLRRRKIAAT
ncbi:hypothetical protein [Larkinella terrae]|uniref:Uncharacterized protein n=1 Tax=Larkinella terrae TaxID=2025311 RepID=A0A7K0EP54_9BACT|nr:hypothetical protein [Larkinella terrae]MRS63620.1 hypothetical protein [Larkinella terrae]